MKQRIKLTESKLKRIVFESVKNILKEVERSRPDDIPHGDEDVYYPCDISPDVWDALQRGDFGDDEEKSDVNESYINRIVKRVINEVRVTRFTPYSKEEGEQNKRVLYSDEHPYKKNPSYGLRMLIKQGWDEDAIRDFFR